MYFIKDREFIRGNVPMTKEEVRAVIISKMNLTNTKTVLDIGGGTGSVSIQASKFAKKVIVIEKEKDAIELIRKNKDKFNASNLEIIEGEAVDKLESIKDELDIIFVGGSGGGISKIIKKSSNKLKSNGIMILTFITLNNMIKANDTLKELGFDMEISSIQVNKVKGDLLMLIAQNPIFIICAKRREL